MANNKLFAILLNATNWHAKVKKKGKVSFLTEASADEGERIRKKAQVVRRTPLENYQSSIKFKVKSTKVKLPSNDYSGRRCEKPDRTIIWKEGISKPAAISQFFLFSPRSY